MVAVRSMVESPSPSRLAVLLLVALGTSTGCGSSTTGVDSPQNGTSLRGDRPNVGGDERMSAMGEMGALDLPEVEATFKRALPDVDECLDKGRARVPAFGGEIQVYLQIDGRGQATIAYFQKSTLGDYDVESCILGVYRAKQWPRPVGGKAGEAHHRSHFGSDPNVAQPQDWSADALSQAMAAEAASDETEDPFKELTTKLAECLRGSEASKLDITLYIDEDGMAQSVGLTGREGAGRKAASCLDMTLKTTSFPAPGEGGAKVTMSIP